MSDYAGERAAHPEPVNLVITTRVPSKWRFVDLETRDVWQAGDDGRMVRAEDRRVLVIPEAHRRVISLIQRPDLAEAIAGRRSQLRQADRNEASRLLDQLERLKAALRLLYPEEMTPHAKRVLEAIFEEDE